MRHSAILVPQEAVNEFQGREQVYTVAANNTAHVNNVTLGPQSGNNWIVESGISNGSLIITDNLQKLREGEPITPEIVEPHATMPQPASSGRR
jgi:membrane fusion protein (multidrug efflux system)